MGAEDQDLSDSREPAPAGVGLYGALVIRFWTMRPILSATEWRMKVAHGFSRGRKCAIAKNQVRGDTFRPMRVSFAALRLAISNTPTHGSRRGLPSTAAPQLLTHETLSRHETPKHLRYRHDRGSEVSEENLDWGCIAVVA